MASNLNLDLGCMCCLLKTVSEIAYTEDSIRDSILICKYTVDAEQALSLYVG